MSAYQEGSREIEVEHRRIPFKDIEAQKIREDVTIQVRHYKQKNCIKNLYICIYKQFFAQLTLMQINFSYYNLVLDIMICR